MNQRIKHAVFSLIIIITALLVVEFSFRIMYSIKQRNPKYLTYGFCDVFKFNISTINGYVKLKAPFLTDPDFFCRGFRTETFPIKKPNGEYRIVALGGSSTMGIPYGFLQSWPYLLQKKLNEDLKDRTYRVINCGMAGQDTYGVNKLLNAEVFSWDPDIVIIYSLYNHINFDTPTLYKQECFANRVYRYIKFMFYDKSLSVMYLLDRVSIRPEGTLRKKIDLYKYLISDSINQCNAHGVKIIIVKQLIDPENFPKAVREINAEYNKLSPSGQYTMYLNTIDEVCGNNCQMVDFSAFSAVCKGRLTELLEKNDPVHLTPFGNDVLADTLAKEIENNLHQKNNK